MNQKRPNSEFLVDISKILTELPVILKRFCAPGEFRILSVVATLGIIAEDDVEKLEMEQLRGISNIFSIITGTVADRLTKFMKISDPGDTVYKELRGKYKRFSQEPDLKLLGRPLTKGFLKFYQLFKELPEQSSNLLALCEMPGGGLLAHEKLYPQGERLGVSLIKDDRSFYCDELETSTKRSWWWINPDMEGFNGDITNELVQKVIVSRIENLELDIVTGDAGYPDIEDLSDDEYSSKLLPVLIAEVYLAQICLRRQGWFIIKCQFRFVYDTHLLLQFMNHITDVLMIRKPVFSFPGNTEIYFVGRLAKNISKMTLGEVKNLATVVGGESWNNFVELISYTRLLFLLYMAASTKDKDVQKKFNLRLFFCHI